MSYSNAELAPFAASDQFNKWRRLMRTVFMNEHKISSTTARRLCELLDALEGKRIAYKFLKPRGYPTKNWAK